MAMTSWLRRNVRRDPALHGLDYMVEQASRHEGTLAWLLARYDLDAICAELRCDGATACRCLLTPRPPMGAFATMVRRLAQQYSIDAAGLERLIRAAEAARFGLTKLNSSARGETADFATAALSVR